MSETEPVVLLQRELSPTQAATRRRIIDAVIKLATKSGYEGFGMRDLAAEASVSPASLYQYYGSKDQVLYDALVSSGVRTQEAVASASAKVDASPRDQMVAAFDKLVAMRERRPKLYDAMLRAYMSTGRHHGHGVSPWTGHSWLDEAISADVANRQAVVEMLEYQVLASLFALVMGASSDDTRRRFAQAVDLLLG